MAKKDKTRVIFKKRKNGIPPWNPTKGKSPAKKFEKNSPEATLSKEK